MCVVTATCVENCAKRKILDDKIKLYNFIYRYLMAHCAAAAAGVYTEQKKKKHQSRVSLVFVHLYTKNCLDTVWVWVNNIHPAKKNIYNRGGLVYSFKRKCMFVRCEVCLLYTFRETHTQTNTHTIRVSWKR